MPPKARRIAVSCLVAHVLMVSSTSTIFAQKTEVYKVRLAPVAISIPMRVNVAGMGMVTASLAGNQLTIDGAFEGLPSNAIAAHIHEGSAAGVRGRVILDLHVPNATNGNISGSYDLTPQQLKALKEGKWYVQIDSEKAPAPDGTLWGWLMK